MFIKYAVWFLGTDEYPFPQIAFDGRDPAIFSQKADAEKLMAELIDAFGEYYKIVRIILD